MSKLSQKIKSLPKAQRVTVCFTAGIILSIMAIATLAGCVYLGFAASEFVGTELYPYVSGMEEMKVQWLSVATIILAALPLLYRNTNQLLVVNLISIAITCAFGFISTTALLGAAVISVLCFPLTLACAIFVYKKNIKL